MILTNQRTQEELKLTHAEFLSKFHKELQDAFASYRKSATQKASVSKGAIRQPKMAQEKACS